MSVTTSPPYQITTDLFARFTSKSEFFAFASACEEGKRYLDLVVCMTQYVSSPIMTNVAWDNEERTLLSVGYKGVVRPLRHSILCLSQQIANLASDTAAATTDSLKLALGAMRNGLMDELEFHCKNFITIVEKRVLGESAFQDDEALIWAYKTVGDHRRYEAELGECEGREHCLASRELAQDAFTRGMNEAQIKLKPTSILRLSLALNFASFRYEVVKDCEDAQAIAQEALDLAETEMLGMPHTPLNDTEHLIRMLRQTLEEWKKQ